MNALAPLTGQMPAVYAQMTGLPDMNAAAKQGISAGFAVVGYKGRNWRLKHGGEDVLLKDARGVPLPTLEVVIVGVSPAVSKIWYEKRYTEGDDQAPDCWSVNGIAPEATAPKRQSDLCATCRHAQWGSRITDAGKKGKACQDSRRIAVVPAGDIENKDYGGPMLLRIPPMSLSNLAGYSTEIGRFGAQPFMVKTQLGFNYDVAYPELTFTALGWITDPGEIAAVAEQMKNPLVERILHDDVSEGQATPAPVAGANTSALAGGPPPATAAMAQTVSAPTPVVEQAPPPRDAALAHAVQEKAQHVETDEEREQREFREFQAAKRAQAQANIDARNKALHEASMANGPVHPPQAAQAAQAAQVAQTPAAPATTKKTPFGAAAQGTQAAQATQPVQQAAALQETVNARQQIQPAPDDMEAAINDLLA